MSGSRLPRLEWLLLAGRHPLLGHGEQHRDRDIGAGDRGEIDDLLVAQQLLRALEGVVRDLVAGRQFVTKS